MISFRKNICGKMGKSFNPEVSSVLDNSLFQPSIGNRKEKVEKHWLSAVNALDICSRELPLDSLSAGYNLP